MIKILILLYFFTTLDLKSSDINLSNLTGFDGEPNIAVNPTNPKNIIAGWMRGRLDGKIWIAAKSSFDEGITWSNIQFMPHDTALNGSADVSIAFNRNGVAFLSYINFRTSPDTAGADFVVSSTDGGINWSAPVKVFDMKEKPDLPIDRPWIAVDNSGGKNDGTIYLTSMSAYWFSGQHHNYLKTSTDNGKSWSTIKQIDNTEYSVGLMTKSSAVISIGMDGSAFIAYHSYDPAVSKLVRILFARTSDLGSTFQRGVITNAFYSKISNSGDFTKSYCIAADPYRIGNVSLAWIDERNGDADVFLKKSTDYSITWTLPLRVNDDSLKNGIEQDEVWMNYSLNGNLGIAWRDRRLNGKGDTVNFSIFSTISSDGGDNFAPNKLLSTLSSPYVNISKGNSFIGVAISNTMLHVNWADLRTGDIEIYYSNRKVVTNVEEMHLLSDGVSIFPNPANTFLLVDINKNQLLPTCYEITDINGNLLFQDIMVNSKVDISSLNQGSYFIKLKMNSEYSIKKFIVIR
ncbi:MAG: exo-alpha-sialidase [Candidatus Kapabacteria bacterium]|nr:exo-alpha-sialidase [Candidatus Kapabacteria bacterium]